MSEVRPPDTFGDVDPLVHEFSNFFENFGVKETIARVWTYVYLSPSPLGQRELGAVTGLSTGMVSMALSQLEEWGAVRVIRVSGSRRLHYEPETQLLGVLRRILRARDLEAAERLEAAVTASLETYDPPIGKERIRDRLRAVRDAAHTYVSLFHAIERVARIPSLVPAVIKAVRGVERMTRGSRTES